MLLPTPSTQFAVSKTGRFAALTNYRYDLPHKKIRSRGFLPIEFTKSSKSPEEYLNGLVSIKDEFEGFNIICGDLDNVWYFSNMDPANKPRQLLPQTVSSVSNNLLDVPWVKVTRGKQQLHAFKLGGEALSPDDVTRLFNILRDDRPVPDEDVQKTLWGLASERSMAPIFVNPYPPFAEQPERLFGTRAQYVFALDKNNRATLHENFRTETGEWKSSTFEFNVESNKSLDDEA